MSRRGGVCFNCVFYRAVLGFRYFPRNIQFYHDSGIEGPGASLFPNLVRGTRCEAGSPTFIRNYYRSAVVVGMTPSWAVTTSSNLLWSVYVYVFITTLNQCYIVYINYIFIYYDFSCRMKSIDNEQFRCRTKDMFWELYLMMSKCVLTVQFTFNVFRYRVCCIVFS